MAALPISDTFNRANGALVGSTTSDGKAVWQAGYVNSSGVLSVNTNQVQIGLGEAAAYVVADSANVDLTIDVQITNASAQPSIVFRYVDASNWLRLEWQDSTGSEYKLTYTVAGAQTSVTAVAARETANVHQMRVLADGTSIKTYFDGVLKHNTTITQHATSLNHGIAAFGSGSRIDNFNVSAATVAAFVATGKAAVAPAQQVAWLDAICGAVTAAQALNASDVAQGSSVPCTMVRKGLVAVNSQALAVASGQPRLGLYQGTTLLYSAPFNGSPVNAESFYLAFSER